MTSEQKRILDEMLEKRLKARRETHPEAIRLILASVFGVTDDTLLSIDNDGTKVDARTVRMWASSYLTPGQKQ